MRGINRRPFLGTSTHRGAYRAHHLHVQSTHGQAMLTDPSALDIGRLLTRPQHNAGMA